VNAAAGERVGEWWRCGCVNEDRNEEEVDSVDMVRCRSWADFDGVFGTEACDEVDCRRSCFRASEAVSSSCNSDIRGLGAGETDL
jgi:hypothetical protein